jgi:HSP20 family protein
MSQLQEEIQRAFSNATDTGHGSNSNNATADWTPAIDVAEYQRQFESLINLPGLDANSIEIRLDNDVLTLSGKRPVEKRAGDNQLMSQPTERFMGDFTAASFFPIRLTRNVSLPRAVTASSK